MAGGDSTGDWALPPDRDGQLRIGGWVPSFATSGGDWPAASLATGEPLTAELPGDGDHPPGGGWMTGPPLATADGNRDHPAGPDLGDLDRHDRAHPAAGPAERDRDAGAAGYHRRRRAARPAARSRRVAGAAVAVGVGLLLVATGLLVQVLTAGPAPLPAPPTPPLLVAPSPEGGPPRQGAAPTGSPESPSATPAGDAGPPVTGSFEAEAGEPGSHGQVTSLAGASGGQVVRLGGRPDGTFVEIGGVRVAGPGTYQLTIFYLAEQPRTGSVAVNGGSPEPVSFPATGAGEVGSVSVQVQLAGSGNTIRVASSGGAPVSVDRVTVSG